MGVITTNDHERWRHSQTLGTYTNKVFVGARRRDARFCYVLPALFFGSFSLTRKPLTKASWRLHLIRTQDDTSKQRRQEREKNLDLAREFRRQADDASGAERDTLLQKAQSFFQKVRARVQRFVLVALCITLAGSYQAATARRPGS